MSVQGCTLPLPLHVSNGLTIHHQDVVYCICVIWYLSCIYAGYSLTRSECQKKNKKNVKSITYSEGVSVTFSYPVCNAYAHAPCYIVICDVSDPTIFSHIKKNSVALVRKRTILS